MAKRKPVLPDETLYEVPFLIWADSEEHASQLAAALVEEHMGDVSSSGHADATVEIVAHGEVEQPEVRYALWRQDPDDRSEPIATFVCDSPPTHTDAAHVMQGQPAGVYEIRQWIPYYPQLQTYDGTVSARLSVGVYTWDGSEITDSR